MRRRRGVRWSLLRSARKRVEGSLGVRVTRAVSGSVEALAALRSLGAGATVIVDAGANDGRSAVRLAAAYPDASIYSLEPVESTYRELVRNTRHLASVRCYPLGLGSAPGTAEIFINEQATRNSLHPGFGSATRSEEIELVTLDGFLEAEGISTVDLLKVDTEGHDLEVLKGATRALSEGRIRAIQVEVGFGQGAAELPRLGDFVRFLNRFDCYLLGVYNQCRSPRRPREGDGTPATPPGVLIYGDALFACRSLLEAWSAEQIPARRRSWWRTR